MLYKLQGRAQVSVYTEIEADSLEAAIEKSKSRCVWMHYEGSGTDPVRDWCITDVDDTVEHVICSNKATF